MKRILLVVALLTAVVAGAAGVSMIVLDDDQRDTNNEKPPRTPTSTDTPISTDTPTTTSTPAQTPDEPQTSITDVRGDTQEGFEIQIGYDTGEEVVIRIEQSDGTVVESGFVNGVGTYTYDLQDGDAPELVVKLRDDGETLVEDSIAVEEGTTNLSFSDVAVPEEHVIPGNEEPRPGDRTSVSYTAENTGTLEAEYEAELYVNGEEVYSGTERIGPGKTYERGFRYYEFGTEDAPVSNITVRINNESIGSVKVPVYYDNDGDGLYTYWETRNESVCYDGECWEDTPTDAEPGRMDLFLNIVYHEDAEKFTEEEKEQLKEWFAEMPVPNPNGSEGITLHITEREDVDVPVFNRSDHNPELISTGGGRDLISVPPTYSYTLSVTEFEDTTYVGAAAGKASAVDHTNPRRTWTATHEILHMIVNEINVEPHYQCHDDPVHACEGFLGHDRTEEYLPEEIGELIAEDGFQ